MSNEPEKPAKPRGLLPKMPVRQLPIAPPLPGAAPAVVPPPAEPSAAAAVQAVPAEGDSAVRPRVESALGAGKEAAKVNFKLPQSPRPKAPARPQPPAPAPAAPATGETSPAWAKPAAPDRLKDALEAMPELDAEATAAAVRAAREKALREQPGWVKASADDSLRNFRRAARNLGEAWRRFRSGPSFWAVAAFVAIYALLAFMRAPGQVVVEQSRRAEEAAWLQAFLKNYSAAGGAVLGQRPHGGTEIYPRGIVLQGELLDAFRQAKPGDTFTVTVAAPMWNPLTAFHGYPPIFAGGTYFQIERKIDFTRHRLTLLLRKDTDRAGAIVLATVEPAK